VRGDFQALGYPGSFSLNFSLRSALLLEEKERCEEVTEEMEQVHSCAWKEARSRGRQGPHSSAEVSPTMTLPSGRGGSNTVERRFKRRFGREAAEKLVKTKKFFLRIWRENVEWDCYPRASENSKVEVELLETFKGNGCLTSENADFRRPFHELWSSSCNINSKQRRKFQRCA